MSEASQVTHVEAIPSGRDQESVLVLNDEPALSKIRRVENGGAFSTRYFQATSLSRTSRILVWP